MCFAGLRLVIHQKQSVSARIWHCRFDLVDCDVYCGVCLNQVAAALDRSDPKQQLAQGASADAIDRDRCVKNIRSMKGLIAAFTIFLGYGLITTQGQPWLPRLVGATFDVFILAVCVQVLYRSKKRLQELDADSAR